MTNKETWVTMITPYTKSGEVDYAGIDKIVDWYVDCGVDGIFSVCLSSEMFHLSLEERVNIGRRVVEAARGRIRVVVSGHVSDGMEDQIHELTEMSKVGAEAVVLVTNRLADENEDDDVWIRNTQTILDALPGVTFGLYECPVPYKRLLTEKTIRWCISTGRFVFLKDTCCDIDLLKERIDLVRGTGFKLFNANAETLFETMRYGADGFCGVMLNFHPDLYAYLVKHCDEDTDTVELYRTFAHVASAAEGWVYPISAKYTMQLNGIGITNLSRTADIAKFDHVKRQAVEQLDHLWKLLKAH